MAATIRSVRMLNAIDKGTITNAQFETLLAANGRATDFSDMLGTDLPGRGTGWMKQKLVYKCAAYPGEDLTARVEITRLRADKELVNLRSTIVGPDGRLICDGESLVLVRNLANKEDKGPSYGRG